MHLILSENIVWDTICILCELWRSVVDDDDDVVDDDDDIIRLYFSFDQWVSAINLSSWNLEIWGLFDSGVKFVVDPIKKLTIFQWNLRINLLWPICLLKIWSL